MPTLAKQGWSGSGIVHTPGLGILCVLSLPHVCTHSAENDTDCTYIDTLRTSDSQILTYHVRT